VGEGALGAPVALPVEGRPAAAVAAEGVVVVAAVAGVVTVTVAAGLAMAVCGAVLPLLQAASRMTAQGMTARVHRIQVPVSIMAPNPAA
jgi:hypothetical protein